MAFHFGSQHVIREASWVFWICSSGVTAADFVKQNQSALWFLDYFPNQNHVFAKHDNQFAQNALA
ncbi:hypothetical protein BST85_11085 [Aureitalea marina]|uniref:Uncharacterized protein n=1 Tax=Aureitalea marina TaxID=930804 RepID=A0A2S7KRX9_9FLAO|nr:hypothetical protein BST85_11085 [Aureitalea marina]